MDWNLIFMTNEIFSKLTPIINEHYFVSVANWVRFLSDGLFFWLLIKALRCSIRARYAIVLNCSEFADCTPEWRPLTWNQWDSESRIILVLLFLLRKIIWQLSLSSCEIGRILSHGLVSRFEWWDVFRVGLKCRSTKGWNRSAWFWMHIQRFWFKLS